jgi:hypothetical protein
MNIILSKLKPLDLHKMKKITLKQHPDFSGVWLGKHGKRAFSVVLPNYQTALGIRPSPSSVKEAIEATSSPGDRKLGDFLLCFA